MTDPQNPDPNTPPPADGAVPPPAPPAYEAAPPAYGAPAQQPPYGSGQPYTSAPPAAYGAPASATVPGKTMGIVAFILSFFLQLVALILGIVALVQSRKAGAKNGFAVAAIIISSVLMVLGVIFLILAIAFWGMFAGDLTSQIQACIDNGGAGTVQINGITMTCEELLSDSGY